MSSAKAKTPIFRMIDEHSSGDYNVDVEPAELAPPSASVKERAAPSLGMDGDDVRGSWQLAGTGGANVRDSPSGKVKTQLKRGDWIEVVAHLKNDWVRIGAPAEVKGLFTRLRHGSGERVWERVQLPSTG